MTDKTKKKWKVMSTAQLPLLLLRWPKTSFQFVIMKDELEIHLCRESMTNCTCHTTWCIRDRSWRLLWMLIRAAVIGLHVFLWKQSNYWWWPLFAVQPLFPSYHSGQWLYRSFYQPWATSATDFPKPAVACCPKV